MICDGFVAEDLKESSSSTAETIAGSPRDLEGLSE